MNRWLTWLLLWALRILAFMPRPISWGVSRLIGSIAYRLAHHRRRIALTNLSVCFPHWPEKKRNEVARSHFKCYSRAFLDRFVFWFGSPTTLRRWIRLEGIEHFEAHRNQPLIFLAPHFLGLEAGGMRVQLETRASNMYSRQSNAELDRWILRGRRRFNDPILLMRSEGIGRAVRWLKRGVPFHYSPDMDLGGPESIFVPFFGVPTATITALVRMARVTGAVIVPLVTRMTDDGYVATFYPGWTHPNDDSIETIEQGVARMNQFIEARVLEMPAQYLWTHRRFKTRPPGEPSIYG
jgi:Kdo2-lipid IVA lauroyltransferase/acyltransferase